MNKIYQTKTGNILICIQGEGLGDGIPRGRLQLVNEAYISNHILEKMPRKAVKKTRKASNDYLSKGELRVLENRVSEIEAVMALCGDQHDDILESLEIELNEIISRLLTSPYKFEKKA